MYIFLININVNKRETLIKQIGYSQVSYKIYRKKYKIAQDKMECKFYKIKCTAASVQVLNCQLKIVILNNTCHSVTTTWGKLILCATNFISSIPIFRTSRQFFRTSRFQVLTGPGPVNFWEIL